MDAEAALAFLRQRQPMPSDAAITAMEAETFASLLKMFEARPDSRCIPLLIKSVSETTGLGMYEHIGFVLQAHPRADVIPRLREGLISGNAGTKYRCCWWAADAGAWELEPQVRQCLEQGNENIRDAAEAFLELCANRQI